LREDEIGTSASRASAHCVRRKPAPRWLLTGLVAGAVLAGCGGGSVSTNSSARSALSDEEMREYDANEGRCHDDGGRVRNVGTVDAYCAFPQRANDFHLVETSHAKQALGAEE
jgi:hypothetical protein